MSAGVLRKLKKEDPFDAGDPGALDAHARYALARELALQAQGEQETEKALALAAGIQKKDWSEVLGTRSEWPAMSPWEALAEKGPDCAQASLESFCELLEGFRPGAWSGNPDKKAATVAQRLAGKASRQGAGGIRVAALCARALKASEGLNRGYGQRWCGLAEWSPVAAGWAASGDEGALAAILENVPRRPMKDAPEAREGYGESQAVKFWKYGPTCKESSEHNSVGAAGWARAQSQAGVYKLPLEAALAQAAPADVRERMALMLLDKGFWPSRLALALCAAAGSGEELWRKMAENLAAPFADGPSRHGWGSDEEGAYETLVCAFGDSLPKEAFLMAKERLGKAFGKSRAGEFLDDPLKKSGPSGIPPAFLAACLGKAGALEALLAGVPPSSAGLLWKAGPALKEDLDLGALELRLAGGAHCLLPPCRKGLPGSGWTRIHLGQAAALSMSDKTLGVAMAWGSFGGRDILDVADLLGGEQGVLATEAYAKAHREAAACKAAQASQARKKRAPGA